MNSPRSANSPTLMPSALPPGWKTPSPAVRELLRQGAEIALQAPPEWLENLDAASLPDVAAMSSIDDPVLLAASRRMNRVGILHWASANIQHPGEPVPVYLPPDLEEMARQLVRRGQGDVILNSGRAVQNAALQFSRRAAFQLTQDAVLLEELLEVMAQSIMTFIDDNMREVTTVLRREQEILRQSSHVDRRDLVARIIQGEDVGAVLASGRLEYAMEQQHHGALIWSEARQPELRQLEDVARELAHCAHASSHLVILANSATLWVWCAADQPVNRTRLEQFVATVPRTRVAIGEPGRGIEGFRSSHLEALTAQRVVGRLRSPACVVSIAQVRLVSLMTQDARAAQHFVSETLGSLATASPILQKSLRVFLECGSNATEAAELLHSHRNTLLRRLEKAEELLPRPLRKCRLDVAAALEVLAWTQNEE